MKHILFERLEKAGFLKGGNVNCDVIAHTSPFEILDFATEPCEVLSSKNLSRDNSVLANAASISLGCGRWPCDSLSCRLKRAEQLAQFAALYSDQVYIRYPFSDYIKHTKGKHLPDESVIRTNFAEDIVLLNYLRPLIESKKILPITPPYICLNCLAKQSLGLKDDKQLKKAFRFLKHRMENEIDTSISMIAGKFYSIKADGPEDLLHHGFSVAISKTPPLNLKKIPRIFETVASLQSCLLSCFSVFTASAPM